MSSVFSGTMQDTFTSDGTAKILKIRQGVDWLYVYNSTIAAASQTTAVGVKFYWQRGFPAGAKWTTFKSNAANAANLDQYITTNGFTLIDNTINVPGASIAVSAISGATPPVVSTTNTGSLSNGNIVRLFNIVGGQQVGGIDFTVGNVIANTSFTLAYGPTIVAAAAGGLSAYRAIPFDYYFYPPTRIISSIEAANAAGSVAFAGSPALTATQAIVVLAVTHAFTIGQKVRFIIPTVTSLAYGMPQLNNVEATIISIGDTSSTATGTVTNTIRVDVDVSSFGTFAWPLTADPVHTPAQVVPVGENTAQAITSGSNIIGDSEINLGYIGILLAGGAGNPGGANGNVMYWVAGKSFSGGL